MDARIVLVVLTFAITAEAPAAESSKYLDAVREFADNVLKYGRDTYGPKHTPLSVDGLNVNTREPVKWISPEGDVLKATETEEWILSNFASRQTLLRTLDGLSVVTGDPKYRRAAMEAIEYAFDNLRAPDGSFYWGNMVAYDALTETVRGKITHHTIKLHYPYYELMWAVDPGTTRKFIEAFWVAHIKDWSNLDMNRIGKLGMADFNANPWVHSYDSNGPVFYRSASGSIGFLTTGSSLIHAGATLYNLSKQEEPLIWSKRLAKRYVATRHPNTGISYEAYNTRWSELGDDLNTDFRKALTVTEI